MFVVLAVVADDDGVLLEPPFPVDCGAAPLDPGVVEAAPAPPWLSGVVAVPLVTGVRGADGPAECGVPGLCGVSGCRNGWLFASVVCGVLGFCPMGLLLFTDLSILAPPKLSLICDRGLKKSLAALRKLGVGGPPGPTPF